MFPRRPLEAEWRRRSLHPLRLPLLEIPALSPIPESPRRPRSSDQEPLPELIIEREPRKRGREDESAEYYDHLAKRMRKYYRMLFNIPKKAKHQGKTDDSGEESSSPDITDMKFLDPSYYDSIEDEDMNINTAEKENQSMEEHLNQRVSNAQNIIGRRDISFDPIEVEEDMNIDTPDEEIDRIQESECLDEALSLREKVSNAKTIAERASSFEPNRALIESMNISQSLSETFTEVHNRPDGNNNVQSVTVVRLRQYRQDSVDTSSMEESGMRNIVVHAMIHDPPRRAASPRRTSFTATPSAFLNRAAIISDYLSTETSASARSSDSERSKNTTALLSSSNDEAENEINSDVENEGSYVIPFKSTKKTVKKNKETDSAEKIETDSSSNEEYRNVTIRHKPTHISIRISSGEVEHERDQQSMEDNITVRKRLEFCSLLSDRQNVADEEAVDYQEEVADEKAVGYEEEAAGEKAVGDDDKVADEKAVGDDEKVADEAAVSDAEDVGHKEAVGSEEDIADEEAVRDEEEIGYREAVGGEEVIVDEEPVGYEEEAAGDEERQEQDVREMVAGDVNNASKTDSQGSGGRSLSTSASASSQELQGRSAGRSITPAAPRLPSSRLTLSDPNTSTAKCSESVIEEQSYSRGEEDIQETVVEEGEEEESFQDELGHGADTDSSDLAGNLFQETGSEDRLETITEVDEPVSGTVEDNVDDEAALEVDPEKEVEVMRRQETETGEIRHSFEAVVKDVNIFKSPEPPKRKHSVLEIRSTLSPIGEEIRIPKETPPLHAQNKENQLPQENPLPQSPTRKRTSSMFVYRDFAKRLRLDSDSRKQSHVSTQTDEGSGPPRRNITTQTRRSQRVMTADAIVQTDGDERPNGEDRGTQTDQQSNEDFYGAGSLFWFLRFRRF